MTNLNGSKQIFSFTSKNNNNLNYFIKKSLLYSNDNLTDAESRWFVVLKLLDTLFLY